MKYSTIAFIVFTLITGVFTSCIDSETKVERAESNLEEANKDLEKANKEYQEDIDAYRKETAEKIATNEKSISDFNARIDVQKEEEKVAYKAKIETLNKKNTDLKMRMDNYKADGKENWEQFKTEFSNDMDELGTAFKNLTVDNVK
jgi:chromosome segregation ATPase